MPEYEAKITSGFELLIASKSKPSVSSNILGFSSPNSLNFSLVQGNNPVSSLTP